MYVKIVPTTSSSTSGHIGLINAIYQIVINNWEISQTDPSYINHGTSFISGTRPTAGIYLAKSAQTAYTSANGSWCSFYKKHYGTGQGSTGYLPQRTINVAYGEAYYSNYTPHSLNDYGFRLNVGTKDYSNFYPNTDSWNTHNWSSYTSTTTNTGSCRVGYDGMNDLSAIHMIVNDTTFMMVVQSSGTSTQIDQGFWCTNDLEHNATYDNFAYDGNSNYCPTPTVWACQGNYMEYATPTVSARVDCCFGVCNQQYMDRFGTYRNTAMHDSASEYHWGSHTTSYGDYPMIEPRGKNNVMQLSGPAGETLHQLVPVQYNGHSDPTDDQGDPRRGRFMNFYRTSNNEFNNGDVLLDGTIRYRVFKCHKTGNNAQESSSQNACYAFPEDNVPFA
jgi:hypothetical protein